MPLLQFVACYEWGALGFSAAVAACRIVGTGDLGDVDEFVMMILVPQGILWAILIIYFIIVPPSSGFQDGYSDFLEHLANMEEPVVTLPAVSRFAERHDHHAGPGLDEPVTLSESDMNSDDEFDKLTQKVRRQLQESKEKHTGAGDELVTLSGLDMISDDEFRELTQEVRRELQEFQSGEKTGGKSRMNLGPKKPSQPLAALQNGRTKLITNIQRRHCPLLQKLPLEVRRLVYAELLIAGGRIENPYDLVEEKLTVLVYSAKAKEEQRSSSTAGLKTDSTILRTCRQIYDEALPMLYQDNTFVFRAHDPMIGFRDRGLPEKSAPNTYLRVPHFRFTPSPQGRLSLIRKLVLYLTDHRAQHRGSSYRLPSGRWVLPARGEMQATWKMFFHESLYDDENDEEENRFQPRVRFPALRDLTLDFSDWNLTEDDALVVRPFIERLRTSEKLSRLEVKGVLHQKSLEELRQRMLKEHGNFVVTRGQ